MVFTYLYSRFNENETIYIKLQTYYVNNNKDCIKSLNSAIYVLEKKDRV